MVARRMGAGSPHQHPGILFGTGVSGIRSPVQQKPTLVLPTAMEWLIKRGCPRQRTLWITRIDDLSKVVYRLLDTSPAGRIIKDVIT